MVEIRTQMQLPAYFAKARVSLGVGRDSLRCYDAFVDAGLQLAEVLDVEEPQHLAGVVEAIITHIKAEVGRKYWVGLALKHKLVQERRNYILQQLKKLTLIKFPNTQLQIGPSNNNIAYGHNMSISMCTNSEQSNGACKQLAPTSLVEMIQLHAIYHSTEYTLKKLKCVPI